MAGVDVPEPKAKRGRGKGVGKAVKKHRGGVRIDLTPMVDIVMLLITFFMLTTVFTTPQTMELNLPPTDAKVEVAETSLLTLRVMADGTHLWNMGIEPPQVVEFKELQNLLKGRLALNDKLIVLVKIERDATFEAMVNVMDELNLSNISRFSTAAFTEIDKRVVQQALGGASVTG
jgi:biopolymer transport protein ExbD